MNNEIVIFIVKYLFEIVQTTKKVSILLLMNYISLKVHSMLSSLILYIYYYILKYLNFF